MEDYSQQIEFLRDELEASKIREETAKHMYDTLLKSITAETADNLLAMSVEELRKFQKNFVDQHNALKLDHSCKMKQLIEALRGTNEKNKELEYQLKLQKLEYEETILELKQELHQNKNNHTQNENFKYISEELLNTRENTIRKLMQENQQYAKEIDNLKEQNRIDIIKLQEETRERIKEIQEIYEHEKFVQNNYIEKIKNEAKIKEERLKVEFHQKLNERLESSAKAFKFKIQRLTSERNEAEAKFDIFKSDLEVLRNDAKNVDTKQRIETSRKMLEFASKTRDELSILRKQISTLEEDVRKCKEKDIWYESQLSVKDAEIQVLKQKLADPGFLLEIDDFSKSEISPEKPRLSIIPPLSPNFCTLATSYTPNITPRKKFDSSFESEVSTQIFSRDDLKLNIADLAKTQDNSSEENWRNEQKRLYEEKINQLKEDYNELLNKIKEIDEDRCNARHEGRKLNAEVKQIKWKMSLLRDFYEEKEKRIKEVLKDTKAVLQSRTDSKEVLNIALGNLDKLEQSLKSSMLIN